MRNAVETRSKRGRIAQAYFYVNVKAVLTGCLRSPYPLILIPAGSVLSAQGPLLGAALALWGGCRIRINVYIDGFNLYYGALKGTSHKWLNVVELSRQLVPSSDVIQQVKYFTARVSGAADPESPRRQQKYLKALGTLPEVGIYYGRFLSKTIWRPLVNLPVAGATVNCIPPATLAAGQHGVVGGTLANPATLVVDSYPQKGAHRTRKKPKRPLPDALIVECHSMEEKGSDVNLAAHMLNDAWKGEFEAALVISNDTDLCTPIKMVSQDIGLPVYVACPDRNFPLSAELAAVATHVRHIRSGMLANAQLPDPLPNGGGSKPVAW